MKNSVELNKRFLPLYSSKKRYFLLTGGRGSLKSTTVHDFVARLTYEKGHGVLFTRYTMTSARTSIIPEFETTLKRLGVDGDFNITYQKVTNKKTGSFIFFSGIKTGGKDQTAKLKSISGITTWIIEEAEDFNDEKIFDDIDDSIRGADLQNRIIMIMNPTTEQHFIFQRWFKNSSIKKKYHGFDVSISVDPELEHIHTTYRMAERFGYLNDSWLSKIRKRLDELNDKIKRIRSGWNKSDLELKIELNKIIHTSTFYYKYIGGWIERQDGVIFDNWKEGGI
jgi:phage terminase large subunit